MISVGFWLMTLSAPVVVGFAWLACAVGIGDTVIALWFRDSLPRVGTENFNLGRPVPFVGLCITVGWGGCECG